MLQRHHEMREESEELYRVNHEWWQENQELHQQLRELRQEQREQQEAAGDYREIRREYQTLRAKYRDLQCDHDEKMQDVTGFEDNNQKLSSALQQAKSQLKDLKKDEQIREHEIEYWKSRYEYVVQTTIQPYANKAKLEYDDKDAPSIDLVLKPLQQDLSRMGESQLEAQSLREQIQELQKEMLAQVQKVQAVSDEQFAQDFRAIIGHIKSLSRSVRLDPGSDLLQVFDSGLLLLDTDKCHWRIRQNQKYYIEAWIWSVLLEHVFATPFAIFGSVGSAWGHNWAFIYGKSQEGNLPSPSASCESYRCTLVNEFVRLAGRETILSGQDGFCLSRRAIARRLAEGTLKCREQVATTIGAKLATISSAVDISQVSSIVDRSFALALEMSLQKCRLQITYPVIGAAFHSSSMSSMPDLDGEDINDGCVAFIVNPGLTKWGDANGKNLDQRYDIVPSLVQLQG